jgi:hypothetical protein
VSVDAVVLSLVPREGDKEPPDVRISAASLDLHKFEENPRTRVSILFPVIPEKFNLPNVDNFVVEFLVHRAPYRAISGLDVSVRSNLLFGYGLASIVVVGADVAAVEGIRNAVGDGLIAAETWQVKKGLLTHVDVPIHPPESELVWHSIDSTKMRDPAVKWIIAELNMNLKRFAQLAATYLPETLTEFRELMLEVQDTAGDIIELEAKATPKELLPIEYKRRWDASVDWLVQLNSSLVYALTQAFHGALPSRFKRGLITPHSLTGTGSSWRAIFRLYLQMKTAFRAACLPKTIESAFPKLPAFEWEKIAEYSATEALPLAKPDAEDQRDFGVSAKVVHFSSRLGFGETDTSLTCPAQSLQTCASAQWSLATVSHEMLHAHVRDLFSAIFTHYEGDEPLTFNDSVLRSIEEYEQSNNGRKPKNLLDAVKFALIDYAFVYRNALEDFQRYYPHHEDEKQLSEHSVDVSLPNREKTLNAFLRANKFTEEVIIHVLDLMYFYRGDTALFVDSLWNTWATVPSTVNKLDWYILRTLLALASVAEGDRYARLDYATKILVDRLKAMEEKGRGLEIVREVIDRLDNQKRFRLWLHLMFLPTLKIVDLARRILYHKELAAELVKTTDSLVQMDRYELEPESFAERGVMSPVAFIFDRLKRSSQGEEETDAIRLCRASCAILLAAGSDPDA